MLVTIIVDASHCGQTFVAGYGFWAASKRGKQAGEGAFRGKIRTAMVAESMAVVNSVHRALKLQIAMPGDDILVQTDCQAAIDHFEERVKKPKEDMKFVVAQLIAIRSTNKLTFKFRHVKGHSRVMDQRSRSQRLSDSRAKRAMRSARKVEQGGERERRTIRPMVGIPEGAGRPDAETEVTQRSIHSGS